MRRLKAYTPSMLSLFLLYSLRELPLKESWRVIVLAMGGILVTLLDLRRISSPSREVQVPVGFKLRALAAFVFSPKVYREILEPCLRDLYDEYCQALAEKQTWKARWVRLRGYWSFWAAFFAQMPISLAKKVYQIWKAIP